MTNAEIKAHWCYVRDLLNCEIPDGTMLTKDQHIERVGFHYVTAMRHAEKHCREEKIYLSADGDQCKKCIEDTKYEYSRDDGWKAAIKDHYRASRPTTMAENEKKDPHYATDDETPTQADIGRMWQKNEHDFERVGV